MTSLIKKRTNDALMEDRLKHYDAEWFLNISYNLHNSHWTMSYFYSIIQLWTTGLCLVSDQTRHFMTAAEPPGLHSWASWWGLLRQNSFRYCETQFLQRRHRLSLSAVRWLTPTTLLSSNITFLMHTNTDTSSVRRMWQAELEWQLNMLESLEVGEEGGGQRAWVSGEVCWGSAGRPGHMVALGGICIKFILPSKLFPACGHQNAVSVFSPSFSPTTPPVFRSLTRTHTTLHSLCTYTNSQREGGFWVVWLSELCVCALLAVLLCICMRVCTALFLRHQERSNH